jgi:transcriptional regulator with XRE-family HTH domain
VTSSRSFDVRTARVNAGYSIRAFARHVGIHDATLRRLEAGERVRPESAKPVADFFEITVTDLMPAAADRSAA